MPFVPWPGATPFNGYWQYTAREYGKGMTRFTGQGWKDSDAEDEHVFRRCFGGDAAPLRNGTYVEMGALNGVTFSNTRFFERELGWSGLLVEPSEYYSDLEQTRGGSARGNTLRRAMVCEQEGVAEGGDASVVWRAPAAQTRDRNSTAAQQEPAKCEPLRSLLRAAHIRQIDFFSLDVDGAELSALRTMDWHVPIGVMVVEMDNQNATKDSAVRALLRHHGMRCARRMGLHANNELWVSTTAILPATGRPYDCGVPPDGNLAVGPPRPPVATHKGAMWHNRPCGT